MLTNTDPSPKGMSPSQQIDAIIKKPGDWQGEKLSQLRALIKQADPAAVDHNISSGKKKYRRTGMA